MAHNRSMQRTLHPVDDEGVMAWNYFPEEEMFAVRLRTPDTFVQCYLGVSTSMADVVRRRGRESISRKALPLLSQSPKRVISPDQFDIQPGTPPSQIPMPTGIAKGLATLAASAWL